MLRTASEEIVAPVIVLTSVGKSSSGELTAGLWRVIVPLLSLFSQYRRKNLLSAIFAPNPGVSFWSRIASLFVFLSDVFVLT